MSAWCRQKKVCSPIAEVCACSSRTWIHSGSWLPSCFFHDGVATLMLRCCFLFMMGYLRWCYVLAFLSWWGTYADTMLLLSFHDGVPTLMGKKEMVRSWGFQKSETKICAGNLCKKGTSKKAHALRLNWLKILCFYGIRKKVSKPSHWNVGSINNRRDVCVQYTYVCIYIYMCVCR